MIAENVQNIRRRIGEACRRAGRSESEVALVAVGKTFPADAIREAVRAGVTDVGENYVQDLRRKHDELAGTPVRWHYIGHLQSNKVKYIAGWISLIQAVDSMHLGRIIGEHAAAAGRRVDLLVEVNTTGEQSKFGVGVESAPVLVRDLRQLPHVRVLGLMTMGPLAADPEMSRPAFRTLRELRNSLQDERIDLPCLSMGMTNDFEIAIEEGATMVRIGTGIFGSRAGVRRADAARKEHA